MSAAKVFEAINRVSAELSRSGIGKTQTNAQDQYQFRGIDDIYNRLSPVLASSKLCILPRVLERTCIDRTGHDGALLTSVSVRTAFDLVSSEDSSMHTIEAFGEALDSGDKATAKAMTAAFKYAVLQAFCIPVSGVEDADASSHKLRKVEHQAEPVQGWEQWVRDITDVVNVCETDDALDRVQSSNRSLLKSLSRERAALYLQIGDIIGARRQSFARRRDEQVHKMKGRSSQKERKGTSRKVKSNSHPATEAAPLPNESSADAQA